MTYAIRIGFLLAIIGVMVGAGLYRAPQPSVKAPVSKKIVAVHPVTITPPPVMSAPVAAPLILLKSAAVMGDVGHTQLVLHFAQKPFYTIQTDATHQIITLALDNVNPQFSLPPLDTDMTAIQSLNFSVTPDNQLLVTISVASGIEVQRLRFVDNNLVLDVGMDTQLPYVQSPVANNASGPVVPLVKTVVPLSQDELAAQNYNEALDLLNQGNTPGAIALLQMLVTQHPDYLDGRVMLSDLLLQQNKAKDALIILKGAMPAPVLTQNTAYYDLLAEAYRQSGDPDAAVGIYQQLLMADSSNGTWWVGLGMCFETLHQHGAAMEAYQKANTAGNLTPVLQAFVTKKLGAEKRDA